MNTAEQRESNRISAPFSGEGSRELSRLLQGGTGEHVVSTRAPGARVTAHA
jgi:hypothetical protein